MLLGWKALSGKEQTQEDGPCTEAGLLWAASGGGFGVTEVLPSPWCGVCWQSPQPPLRLCKPSWLPVRTPLPVLALFPA